MKTHSNTLTRYWVNSTQTAAIRLGDFTPTELRAIAAEIESICPPVPIATAEATPAEGGWVYQLMWSKVQEKNVSCAVNRAFGIVVPFGGADGMAKSATDRFNAGTSKAADYYAPSIDEYEEPHV